LPIIQNCVHLAPFNTNAALGALIVIDDGVVVRACNRLLYPEFGDTPEYSAAAAAAVAHIEDTFNDIAYTMHQSGFLCLIEDLKRFLLRDITGSS
jgi:hypothetical protein